MNLACTSVVYVACRTHKYLYLNFNYLSIITNNLIKKSTLRTTREFLQLQQNILEKLTNIYENLTTIKDTAHTFLDDGKQKIIEEYKPYDKVQLAVCGYNSPGKTSFVHELLECGNVLPTGTGAISARIVKFTYASNDQACIVLYRSIIDGVEIKRSKIDLSSCFIEYSSTKKANVKALKEKVKEHLLRPIDCDEHSHEFEKWASFFVEIRLPSPILELGLELYDTPGFLASDAPVLRNNLLALIKAMRPSLLFLYDNPTVSDDTRKCFEQFKLTLSHHFRGTGIFFLNTKADVTTIRNDHEEDDEDETTLLEKERLKRFNLLLKVNEMSSDLSNEMRTSLENCDCFDIFSVQQPTDPMEIIMKNNTINRIISFAAKHDLKSIKQVSEIILTVIDAFFDFVLITNRRSQNEWDKLRDEAFQWGKSFFQEYRLKIDYIVNEINRRLPQRFRERRDNIEKRAVINCERGRWWQRNAAVRLAVEPFIVADICANDDVLDFKPPGDRNTPISSWDPNYCHKKFLELIVENEIFKPVFTEVLCSTNNDTSLVINQQLLSVCSTKNELLNAAYREILKYTNDMGVFLRHRNVMNVVDKFNEKEYIREFLQDFENKLSTRSEEIRNSIGECINKGENEFVDKINCYHKLVLKTIAHRQKAYELACTLAPQFARIECQLVANLDLSEHNGDSPDIKQEVIGEGGLFLVHPCSWGSNERLVAKELRDSIVHRNIDYMEAHFHRTVTRLNINHIAPLRYLYEKPDEPNKLFILLPHYETDLHRYLLDHIHEVSLDKAIQISLDIARIITQMHSQGLVHRDIKVSNILLDTNQQVLLADFGTCKHGVENSTFIGTPPFPPELTTNSSSSSSFSIDHQCSYEGSAFDVYSLGVLMYMVSPKPIYDRPNPISQAHINALDQIPETYRQLISRCLNVNPKDRPTAKEVVAQLELITEQVANSKPCLICLDELRFARCLPCRHKTMCRKCLLQAQQATHNPKCIICNEIFTNAEEDTNANTYMPT
ncbi:unnamed protein product [Didymodactylos carnosus]|uniref:Uncharacterized protein n=1 Tax=Didymodactylos carnosus TaxID=1234261 RepID=A0A8S2KYA9_9BILA|nr:unnamed protein product [Didymodactylos carnosus]